MFQSSSRIHVMNHNWSARKQRLHLQSAARISRHSALSEDRIRQCGTSSESRCKDIFLPNLVSIQCLQYQCLQVAISFCRHRSVRSVRKWFSDLEWLLTQISRLRYYTTSNNLKMVQYRAIVTVADYQQVVCSVSNGATFNDLERPITNISRSHHYLTLNISETARGR